MGRAQRSVDKEAFWRGVITEQQRSGLNVRAFCRARAISEPSFYVWRRTLQARDTEKTATGAEPDRLIPVTVLRSPDREQPTAGTKKVNHLRAQPAGCTQTISSANNFSSAGVLAVNGAQQLLEIGTPGGFTLRFAADATSETIVRVLDILARCEAEGTSSC